MAAITTTAISLTRDHTIQRNGNFSGSGANGRKVSNDTAAGRCSDWTSTTASGRPWCGHSWPRQSGTHWIHSHQADGCGACVHLQDNTGPSGGCVGGAGGYGGIYCFATTP